jgi:hypothetical protein
MFQKCDKDAMKNARFLNSALFRVPKPERQDF